jgi:general L-amino acid transport system substrate-binding protein
MRVQGLASVILCGLLLLLGFPGFGAAAEAATLDRVKARGHLVCGTSAHLTGFAEADPSGEWSGFDVDYCRAIAAVIFNDPTKVTFLSLAAPDRLSALQTGTIDVLADNIPWTLSREPGRGVLFTAINFFDGEGFMVHQKLNISSVLELSGGSICVQQGTTNEINLADFFHAHQMRYQAVGFATADAALKAYVDGACDAIASESSWLYAQRVGLSAPADNVILPEIVSKEAFGLLVRQGDDQWFNLVKWVHYVMVDAEDAGVSSQNVDSKMASEDPDIRKLLGAEGDFGEALGLSKDWAYRLLKLVGNYGEVFDRNLGDGSNLKMKRGLNALWSRGGLQYAPPVR